MLQATPEEIDVWIADYNEKMKVIVPEKPKPEEGTPEQTGGDEGTPEQTSSEAVTGMHLPAVFATFEALPQSAQCLVAVFLHAWPCTAFYSAARFSPLLQTHACSELRFAASDPA